MFGDRNRKRALEENDSMSLNSLKLRKPALFLVLEDVSILIQEASSVLQTDGVSQVFNSKRGEPMTHHIIMSLRVT